MGRTRDLPGVAGSAPYRLNGGESQGNKHYRADLEDPISGRHSS